MVGIYSYILSGVVAPVDSMALTSRRTCIRAVVGKARITEKDRFDLV